MGIEALPSSTVRTIGATQVLNDPASMVKELIDNALDVKSTSIAVEIHSNTLDSIQVRDNGHGIPPEDRLLVARPHCTSKISGEDDLKAIGSVSLGFRGEALASAAEMSGSLTISTRVEGEEVASALKVNQQGEVVSQSRASFPVGTTVKVTDFIKAHPVRRQVALKNAEKTLATIKQKLKAYAFARPHVRFSLRVIRAKNDKGNWTYAPKASGNAEDAAYKIVGAGCASQCTWSIVEDQDYTLQAFLPRPDADASKCANIGSFIAIDARPVSTARGIPKQMQKIFREALKRANLHAEATKEPFLFLNIKCPTASYDANVEPAKDDVLFENADIPVALLRRLLDAVYPAPAGAPEESSIVEWQSGVNLTDARQRDNDPLDDGFLTSLEPTTVGATRGHETTPWTAFGTEEPVNSTNEATVGSTICSPFRANMYGCDEEDWENIDARPATDRTDAEMQELRQARQDVNISNPWILAKMNAIGRRQPELEYEHREGSAANRTTPAQTNQSSLDGETSNALLTPDPSSPAKAHMTPYAQGLWTSPHITGERSMASQDRTPSSPSFVPPAPLSESLQSTVVSNDLPQRALPYKYNPIVHDEPLPGGTPLAMTPQVSSQRRESPKKQTQRSSVNKRFKPPAVDQPGREKVWFDHLQYMDQPRPTRRQYQSRQSDGLVVPGELGDFVEDPRPLTPPRMNRDVREFFTPRAQPQATSVSDLIETRQYPQRQKSGGGGGQDGPERSKDESIQSKLTSNGHNNGRGNFVRASELSLDENEDLPQHCKMPMAKRRRTSARRALREISGNTDVQTEAVDNHSAGEHGNSAISRRRHTTDGSPSKPRRTKSARLPLERVPKGQGTQNVVLHVSKGMRDISLSTGSIEEQRSLLAWNETSLEAYDTFATLTDPASMTDITETLRVLLTDHVAEGQLSQDLGVLVGNALAAHAQAALEEDV